MTATLGAGVGPAFGVTGLDVVLEHLVLIPEVACFDHHESCKYHEHRKQRDDHPEYSPVNSVMHYKPLKLEVITNPSDVIGDTVQVVQSTNHSRTNCVPVFFRLRLILEVHLLRSAQVQFYLGV